MAYDEELDQRISDLTMPWGAVRKPMFGGTGYLVNGNMMAGVHREFLVLRLSEGGSEAALAEPHVLPFDMTGRPMRGWVMVEPEGLDDDSLARWLEEAREHAESLPPK